MIAKPPSVADVPAEKSPYRAAAGIFAVVLAGYVATLAPGVTFWDAGELIASSKILGIPHPPGTPLFVLMAHVWAALVPIGGFAYRTNLMTAVFSAGAAAWFFLLTAEALKGWGQKGQGGQKGPGRAVGGGEEAFFRYGGAAAAALASAFAFTVWQNSNETEVYMVATFSIAAIAWLAWLWRRARGTDRASHILLLIIYLGAVSVGAHLLTLLIGPALIVFMWHVMRTEPLADGHERGTESAQFWVLAGMWALLIGTGLGSTTLMVAGGLLFLAAAGYAVVLGRLMFPLAVLGIAVVGVSTYTFLYVRAGLDPFINEADPRTWDALVSVIRREQYPPRSPIDDPTHPSGPDNPGRTIGLIGLQIVNYLQYFDWQWSHGLAGERPFALIRLPVTLLFITLGSVGARAIWHRDRAVFWLLLVLFVTTGIGLMGYMNFKPGFSLAWDQYRESEMHEVRERDYFFTVSFQVWGLFAGVGIATIAHWVRQVFRQRAPAASWPTVAGGAILALALLPFGFNFRTADRARGPEAGLPRDFAYDLLQSVEPYGILFTNGDNDTFPLWYLQEAEGIRQDVAVVNLSLGNTDWYVRQLRDNPVRPFVPAQAPWLAHLAPDKPPAQLHTWTDDEIRGLQPLLLPRDLDFRAGRISHVFPKNTPLWVKDILILRLIQENVGRRQVFYSLTAGNSSWAGMNDYLSLEALVLRLNAAAAPDSSRFGMGLLNVPLDVTRTDSLAWNIYRYAGLLEKDAMLDATSRNIAVNLSYPFYSLSVAYAVRGDTLRSQANLERGMKLWPNPELAADIRRVQSVPPGLLGDTGTTNPRR